MDCSVFSNSGGGFKEAENAHGARHISPATLMGHLVKAAKQLLLQSLSSDKAGVDTYLHRL